jgi:hypothetical protein
LERGTILGGVKLDNDLLCSRALFGSSSKNLEPLKLGSSRGLVSLSKKVHPRVKDGDGCTSKSDKDVPIATKFKINPACPSRHEDGLSRDVDKIATLPLPRNPTKVQTKPPSRSTGLRRESQLQELSAQTTTSVAAKNAQPIPRGHEVKAGALAV